MPLIFNSTLMFQIKKLRAGEKMGPEKLGHAHSALPGALSGCEQRENLHSWEERHTANKPALGGNAHYEEA